MEAPAGVTDGNTTGTFSVYPNPIEGSARVSFYLANSGAVTVSLYSILGQVVTDRNLGVLGAGQHETAIDVQGLPAGIYILRVNTGSNVYSRKVTVAR
jgi:hypothetical protein